MTRAALAVFAAACPLLAGAVTDSAQRKIDLIQHDRVPRGSVVVLSTDELNLYVRNQIAGTFRQGIRGARLDLGAGRVTGSAYIDFPKLRQAMGKPLGWLMSWLLAGERRVQVDAHIRSSGGRAEVDLDRVAVSGFSISGGALDYLIRNFVWPYYPAATIGRPFLLAHHVDRLEVRPTEARVAIAK
ncbi:MAG: hypothetical protein ABSH46_08720 [Bryobacteraceae bacterium]|jgi:hypothetical protein